MQNARPATATIQGEKHMIPELNGKSSRRAELLKSKAKKAAPRPHANDEVRDLPLVEKDGLSFRIVAGARDALADQPFNPVAVAEGFRAAFAGVWKKIPPADRQRMLAYWRRGGDTASRDRRARDEKPAPLIRVVCGSEPPDDVIARCGMEISFPASLVLGQPLSSPGRWPARWPGSIGMYRGNTGAWSWK